ncbi:hypothetical protein QEN19_001093 [Hanseniaspora menglaensis]
MGNNSSKPINEGKVKRGGSIKKKKKNTVSKSGAAFTAEANLPSSENNSTENNSETAVISAVSSNNKPLLKKKVKMNSKSSIKSKESDIEVEEADQEDDEVDDDADLTDLNGNEDILNLKAGSGPSKFHRRSSSQGSILTSSRRSHSGSNQLLKTQSRASSSGQQQDSSRPYLKHRSRSSDSVHSSQQPRISSRKSSMSEVPASMNMSLEPRGSILKRTNSNISSSASQSRHASDNALTDGYDDDEEEDDDGEYQGYNRSEVYEDIYKTGNISRGILKNSSSNSNMKGSQQKKNIKHRSSSSSIPGGLTRTSTRGSTSNSEHNHAQSRRGSQSGSEKPHGSYDTVNEMMDDLKINKNGEEVSINNVPPPLIHRHSSFGTDAEQNFPIDLEYPDGQYANSDEIIDKDGEIRYQNKARNANNNGADEYPMSSDNFLEYDENSQQQENNKISLENISIPGNGKYKTPLDLDATIQKLLDAGYSGKRTKNVILKNSEIQQICTIAREIFLQQPSLLELSPPVKIVGDVHGQFHDLIRMFEKCGFPPSSNYLFLGDYVDRGKQSLETILLLLCYKIKYPENFFLLRGNHECASVTRVYGFYDECKRRCNVRTWKYFIDTFNTMPLAAIVAGKIFCVHGGLSPVLNSMDEIRLVSRPTDVPDFGLINDLLWSDPTDSVNEWEDNERGVSYCYNKVAINKFLNRFGFDLVCRAHMVVEDGYEFFNDHTLVTVFSAPNYCGEFDNWGAVMSVNDELLCSFELMEPLDSIALKQVMKRGKLERKLAMEENFEEFPNESTQAIPIEQ